MALPITGPFTSSSSSGSPISYYSYKESWKQAKPYSSPLSYKRRVGTTGTLQGSCPEDASTIGGHDWIHEPGVCDWTPLENSAYGRFKDKVSDSANLAVNLAEAHQSYSMIAKRGMELYGAARAILKGNFGQAAKIFKMAVVPKGASVKKNFANNWLEYYFGWKPLIGDIYTSVEILQNPVKNARARGSARENTAGGKVVNLAAPYETNNPSAVYPSLTYSKFYKRLNVEYGLAMGADIAVANANLFLANQYGLLNPATFLFEKIPFSFVADWFFNLEQVISSMTDFMGLTVQGPWNTAWCRGHLEYLYVYEYRYFESGHYVYTRITNTANIRFSQMQRSLGLIYPTLSLRPWKIPSKERAFTAASLLTQIFSGR